MRLTRRWLAAACLLVIAPCVQAQVAGPVLLSKTAVIVEADTGNVVYARDEDAVRPIASITKLMTALVVLEAEPSMSERLVVTKADAVATANSGSRLPIGARLTRAQLLQLSLMASENRATHALARNYPGGVPAALRAMRRKARALGMTTAEFADPTGLSPGNVASGNDLLKLVRAASEQPAIRAYSTAPSLTVKVYKRWHHFRNTDRLVAESDWDVTVSKTGYIRAAGLCLVLETVVERRPYRIVLLDSRSRIGDARAARAWLQTRTARALSDGNSGASEPPARLGDAGSESAHR